MEPRPVSKAHSAVLTLLALGFQLLALIGTHAWCPRSDSVLMIQG